MNLEKVALNDNVLIEFFDAATKTAGGIIIPDAAQQKPDKGTIISVGSTVKDPNIKVGNIAFAVQGCSKKNPVEIEGRVLNLVKDYDLLMLIPKAD